MNSSALTPSPSSSSCFTKLSKQTNTNTIYYNQFKLHKERERKLIYKSLKCSRSSDSPPSPKIDIQISCSAATETPAGTSYLAADDKLQRLVSEFKSLPKPIDRVKRLLHYAARLPPFDESARVAANRVMGCTAQVWLEVSMDEFGRMRFGADSDSEITKAFCSCLIWVLDGAEPEEVLKVKSEDLSEMNVGLPGKSHSRVNTWHNVLTRMQKRTKALVAEREGKPPVELFPSLVVSADDISAKGSYAEAQARFLFPDYLKVKELVNVLKDKKIGVVAHFYMDPEVQGVLTAAQKLWPHIHISDSLVMADTAVKMAEAGCQFVTVLGVDFMSENVRAILDQAGFRKGFAQIPNLNVCYGPDSYMGANIGESFQQMATMINEDIAEIHPDHNGESIRSLLPRLHYYHSTKNFMVNIFLLRFQFLACLFSSSSNNWCEHLADPSAIVPSVPY